MSATRKSKIARTPFAASMCAVFHHLPDWARSSAFGAALRDAYRRGETVVVNDVRTDPRFTDRDRITLEARQIAAFVGVMLMKGGRLVAAFGANHATPRLWTPSEIELIRDVAERTWEAAERARAEAALRQREQRLRLALDASAGGSWTWDASTNRVDWDDGFRVRYGFAPEEPPTFEAWLSRVHEDDRPQVLALLDEIRRTTTRVAWDNTFRIVRPDGAVLWIQSLGRADRDVNGQVTRLTGLEFDVTERRRIEEALQARRDEERDRELRLLLETAAQGIVSVDAQGADRDGQPGSRSDVRVGVGRAHWPVHRAAGAGVLARSAHAASHRLLCRPASTSDGRRPRSRRDNGATARRSRSK